MHLIDQNEFAHEITAHVPGRAFKNGNNGTVIRYTMEGATHPKGMPIRFKSIDRLINWARNECGLILKRS